MSLQIPRAFTQSQPLPTRCAAAILLVDADPVVRLILADFLQRQGHDVVQAGTVEEALARLDRHAIGLVFVAGDLADRLAERHPALTMIVMAETAPGREDIHTHCVIGRNDLDALLRHSSVLLRRLH